MRDFAADASLMALNTATLGPAASLADAIEGCVRHGIGAISPWRDKIAAHGLDNARRHIADAGLAVNGVVRGGMFTAPDWLDDNRRAVDEAAALGAASLVLVAGGLESGSRDLPQARALVAERLAELLPHARDAGVPLAIEPLHPMYAADRACVNTLAQALDLCEALGTGVGVAIDVYHVWWDPDLATQVARAGRMGAILAYHVCDWRVPTRDLLLDRAMPGDGVIDLKAIRAMVEATGFDGFAELEVFSEADWWQRPVDEVLTVGVERHRTVV
ncbi:MAG: sugar phosphate isomerase/epimerase family protein [Alphaproteobacteria bacterium]